MSDRNPRRAKNWKLVCRLCGHEFADTKTVGEIQQQHFKTTHETDDLSFDLKWVGRGRPPVSGLN